MNKQELSALVSELLQTMGQEPQVKGSDYRPTDPGPQPVDTHLHDGDFVACELWIVQEKKQADQLRGF